MKEDIQNFDAHKVTPDARKGVEELLRKNGDSFEAKVSFIIPRIPVLVNL